MGHDSSDGAVLWAEVSELLGRVLELPEQARVDFLRKACLGNMALQAAVHGYLHQRSDRVAFLDQPLFGAAASDGRETARLAPPPCLAGRVIPPYVLTTKLGAGTTGQVYLAERLDIPAGGAHGYHPQPLWLAPQELPNRCAVKLTSARLSQRAEIVRFVREQEALSALQHQHVLRFLGWGKTLDGHCFFFLEHFVGESLDVAARKLPLRAIGNLFQQVLSAIVHAHGRGFAHSDLSPANILVSPAGDDVRIIDFGNSVRAKASTAREELRQGSWDLRRPPGTSSYVCPCFESGLGTPAMADLYAIGVLATEMALGRRPRLPFKNRTAIRLVLERSPKLEELSASILSRSSIAVFQERFAEVLWKCLSTDLGDRYPTAEELGCAFHEAFSRLEPSSRTATATRFAADKMREIFSTPRHCFPGAPPVRSG